MRQSVPMKMIAKITGSMKRVVSLPQSTFLAKRLYEALGLRIYGITILLLSGCIAPSTFEIIPAQAYDGELFVVCGLNPRGDNYLSLRACGSTRCAEIMRLGPDTPLRSWEPWDEGGWRHVDVLPYLDAVHGGNYVSGWVFQKYICPVRY